MISFDKMDGLCKRRAMDMNHPQSLDHQLYGRKNDGAVVI
jgi:hypothetical protein